MSQQKPHVLLLINDEHRPDVLPIEGDQQVRTPTLDRFINEGNVYFSQCVHPLTNLCTGTAKFYIWTLSAQLWQPQLRRSQCLPRSEPFRGISATTAITHAQRERCTSSAKMSCTVGGSGWGRDIVGDNGYPYPAVDDEHTAQFEREPGTGSKQNKVIQEIR